MEVDGKKELFPEKGCKQRQWRGRHDTTLCQCMCKAGAVPGHVQRDADGIIMQALGGTWSRMDSLTITVSNVPLQLGETPNRGRIKNSKIKGIK